MSHARTQSVTAPFRHYLGEIAQIAHLSAEEEKRVAQRVAQGDAAAREQLATSNLCLVVTVARTYLKNGLMLEDLVGEGNLGLLRAVESFDPSLGTKFATYAAYWIRQSIRQSLVRDRSSVRLPHYMLNLLTKWHAVGHALHRELGRPATEEEIAVRMGLSRRRTRAVRKALRVRASGQTPSSPEGQGDDALDRLPSEREFEPVDTLAELEEQQAIVNSLGGLNDREVATIRRRFGLDGMPPASLRETGEQLGCTHERIRQIEHAALAKLRPYFTA